MLWNIWTSNELFVVSWYISLEKLSILFKKKKIETDYMRDR